MTADDTPGERRTVGQEIAAAVTLATGSPDETAAHLLEDRRIALRWWLPLFSVSVALWAALVVGLRLEHQRSGANVGVSLAVTVSALAVGTFGGVRRWVIDWSRLQQRHADAALDRRQRLLLLRGVNRGNNENRTPLPLLIELATWRLAIVPAETAMVLGLSGSWVLSSGFDSWDGPRSIVVAAFLLAMVTLVIVTAARERSRCRRFLVDSARWARSGDAC